MKYFAGLVALLLLAACFIMTDVQMTERYLYNNGYHKNCGGAWMHCERDTTGEWFYCSSCGVEKKFP